MCGLRFIYHSKVVVFAPWNISSMQNVFAEGNFYSAFFHCFLYVKCFSTQERMYMYTNIHIFWEMLNRVVVGLFRSKMEVKSSKSVCRGIFLFPLFNPLFTFEWCVERPKIFLPSFKTVRHSWRDFFPKEWRSTTFQGRLSSSLHVVSTVRVVIMEYRGMLTHVAAGRTLLDRELCKIVRGPIWKIGLKVGLICSL